MYSLDADTTLPRLREVTCRCPCDDRRLASAGAASQKSSVSVFMVLSTASARNMNFVFVGGLLLNAIPWRIGIDSFGSEYDFPRRVPDSFTWDSASLENKTFFGASFSAGAATAGSALRRAPSSISGFGAVEGGRAESSA